MKKRMDKENMFKKREKGKEVYMRGNGLIIKSNNLNFILINLIRYYKFLISKILIKEIINFFKKFKSILIKK